MIRVPARVRSLVRIVATCTVAGVVLASCATVKAIAPPHVTGHPAISISVPLSNVACTTDNACVALGTSNLDVSPTSVGEYRAANGHWTTLAVPSATASTTVQSSACWNDGCLFVGSQSSGDLVWRYDTGDSAMSIETAPTDASGIEAISCYAPLTCAILDDGKLGPRFFTTTDGGITWTLRPPIGVGTLDSVTALSCQSNLDCMASFINDGDIVYVTRDGGTTWTPRTGFSTVTWSALESLNCYGDKCLGVANTSSGWRIVRTDNLGRLWSKVAALKSADVTLACTSYEHCVVGGFEGTTSSLPWLATVTPGSLKVAQLKYVPSPLVDVACGTKICAAIAVTTVMTLRP
jgi:photosystem II stability/assembly factor-like uncharacterized protein